MEDDLNKIFAEFERQGIEVTIYSRMVKGDKSYLADDLNKKYEVSVGLSLGDKHSTRASSISVSGVGSTFRAALTDAFFRIEQMRDTLGWRPSTPPSVVTLSDDDIPF